MLSELSPPATSPISTQLHADKSPAKDVELGISALPGGPLDGAHLGKEEHSAEDEKVHGVPELERGSVGVGAVSTGVGLPADGFPDGGSRAWLVVAGAWCISFVSWGFVNGFGVFQSYYSIYQLQDRSPSDISWIGSFQLAMVLACAIFSGKAFDAGYVRYLMIGGGVIYIAGLFGLSFAETYVQIFLAQGVACGLAAGILFLPAVSSISHYFTTRRATALGILATGSSIGGVVYPILLNETLNSNVGFGWGVRACGFLTLGMLIFASLTVKTRLPPRRGGKIIDFTLFKDPVYSLFIVGVFFIMWGLYTPFFYLQSYAIENGVDPNIAFYALSILNAASIFGRIIPNWLADTYGPLTILAPNCLLSGILILVWIPAGRSEAGLIVFSILFGFSSGAYVSMLPACIASMTENMNEIGIRMAMSFLVVALAALTGTPIAGAIIAQQNGSYTGAAICSAIMAIVGSIAVFVTRVFVARRKGTIWV